MMSGTSNQQIAVETSVQSALIKAVENDDEGEVKRLIGAGEAVDETDNMNALFEAVRRRNETLVHLLVEEGKAFVNARDLYGRTPLFYAITQSKKIAEYLVEKGADVNLKDFSNRSALSFFVENCMMNENIPLSSLISAKAEEFEMLKDPSEDVNHNIVKTILGIVICKLPLMCASSKILTDKTRELNQETFKKIWDNVIPALKMVSTYLAEKDTTKKTFLDNILKGCEEKTPLVSAMCDEVIALLVEIGADPNFADSDGNTALHYAACLPFLGVSTEVIMSMFGQLERYGLTLNTRNHRNETPLLFCLSGSIGHLEENERLTVMKTLVDACKFLVKRGSSLDETSKNGESVFHLVIKLFQQGFEIPEQRVRENVIVETMKILHLFSCDRLIKGSTVNKGDSRLNSPLHYWAKLTLPCHTDYSSNDSFEATLKEILEHLLKLGATLNPRNEDEETPLHICQTWRAVKLLLAEGANPNDLDSSGHSLIIAAVNNKTYLMKPNFDESNNESVVRALIAAGADVNITDNEGKTALFYVVQQSNNESVLRALIGAGADVTIIDNDGKTAFFYAAFKENEESMEKLIKCCALFNAVEKESKKMVDKLIECGADVNATNKCGETVLFYAVDKDNEKMVEKLIECGANVNAANEYEETVLLCAVLKENEKMVQKLIECGADINATDKYGETILLYAVEEERENMVDKLIECGADINATNKDGANALFYAVLKENKGLVEKLIKCGADINATDKYHKTALFYAEMKENKEMVQRLIECGANINAADKSDETAFFNAAQTGNKTNVKTMFDCGANTNASAKSGTTSLFSAVEKGNEKLFQKLVDCGADVNTTDEHSRTALFYAVQQWNDDNVVRALSDAGADVNRTDNTGRTALFYAVQQRNNDNVVRALIDAGAHVNRADNKERTALFYAVQQWNNDNVVRALIDAGAAVNRTDINGKTALFYAIGQSNNETLVRALVDAGADVNQTDNKGKSALFYAVQQSNNERVVRALIDAGADVNKTDNEKKTALFYAVQQSNNERVVSAMIDAGALWNVRDHYGRTPLFYDITKSGSLSTYLIERGASLYLDDNFNVLTFFIEECFEFPSDLQDRLKISIKRKMVTKKQILEAIISVAFSKVLSFNQSSCGVDAHSLSALLKLAGDYTSMFDVRKREAIRTALKTINEQQKKSSIEPELIGTILRRLVKLGANPNCFDPDGNTGLHHAIKLSSYDVPEETVLYICSQMKEIGASFHIKNLKKETPLLRSLVCTIKNISGHGWRQWSEVKTQLAVCQFLIEQGSNVEETTLSGQSALHLILELLRQFLLDEQLRNSGLAELMRLFRETFSAHKEKGLQSVIKDNSGNTPLHLWAKFELPSNQDYSSTIAEGYTFQGLLKMILDHFRVSKAQMHAKNENGETPLHLCRTWTAVELLLDAGANPNDVDSSGRTPLLAAAKNRELGNNQGSLYPDILLAPDKFLRRVLNKGLDPWTVDIHDESLLSELMESESHGLARSLVDVACDDIKVRSRPLTLFSLLTAVCRDKLTNAHWKKDAAEMILSSTTCPVNGNANEDSPLHYCCSNIVEASRSSSIDEIKTTVHWCMVKLLRSFGANNRIPDATNQSCFDIAEECPALKDLLMEPIDLDRFLVLIRPWKSVSKTHERCLAKVARHLESKHVESYWYHEDHLAFGSFGVVFAGINEKDGREVAIKRIEKLRMQRPKDKREITNLTALADCEQVVRYLSFFEDEHFSYIVLELMDGNLDDLLNKSTTMKVREKLCHDLVKGLSYVHGLGYLHRDLKPTNILFKNFPKLCLKIADFGLSCHMDSTGSSTSGSSTYGSYAGTRCWIAPEVLRYTKDQHSTASDMFSFGLVLHYILSVKKHPFSPDDWANKGGLQIRNETETNVIRGNKEGWDECLSPEAANLVEQLLESEAGKRPTAAQSLAHPLFWSKTKKVDLLIAVGNQPEFECPRARRTIPLTEVETDLEASFGTIMKYGDWNDPGYLHMPAISTEMTMRRRYQTNSVVELVRFIRHATVHVSESTRPTPIKKQLLEDFVFLKYFPNLVMEVYKAVTTHGWDHTREEIKYALKK